MSVEAKLSRLSLDLKSTQVHSPNASGVSLPSRPETTPESWDDAAGDAPVEAPGPSLKQIVSNEDIAPPPPTPVSPQDAESLRARRWEAISNYDSGKPTPRHQSSEKTSNDKRPEKSVEPAKRMIAGALGIKAPKKTEEQKQYEAATREAEIRRKNREKELRERERLEDDQAKAAVWDS